MSEFYDIIKEIIDNDTVQSMKKYRQHCNVSCFEHSYNVARVCYSVAKKLRLDYVSITRAGMLHDLFLYDWHAPKEGRKGFHAFTHGDCACRNATRLFKLTKKEQDMIRRHMWPVTPIPPMSIEGFLLTFVDKYCAVMESIDSFKKSKE